MMFYLYSLWGCENFNTNTYPYREGSPYSNLLFKNLPLSLAANDYTNFNTFGGANLALMSVMIEA